MKNLVRSLTPLGLMIAACGGTVDAVVGGPDASGTDHPAAPTSMPSPPAPTTPPAEWTTVTRITRENAEPGDSLGEAIAATDSTIVATSKLRDDQGRQGTGLVFFGKVDASWKRHQSLFLGRDVRIGKLALSNDVAVAVTTSGMNHVPAIVTLARGPKGWIRSADVPSFGPTEPICDVTMSGARALAIGASGAFRIYARKGASWSLEYAGTVQAKSAGGVSHCARGAIAEGRAVIAQPAGAFDGAGVEVAALRVLEAQGGWHETTTLMLEDTTHQSVVENSQAEVHLATAGDWLFVSTPRGNYNGKRRADGVQLFRKTNAGWLQADDVRLSPTQARCNNACAIAADDHKLIVKVDYHTDDPDKASLIVFRRDESDAWVQSQALDVDNGDSNNVVVTALAMGGSTVVRSQAASNIAAEKAGALRVFTESGDGTLSPASTGTSYGSYAYTSPGAATGLLTTNDSAMGITYFGSWLDVNGGQVVLPFGEGTHAHVLDGTARGGAATSQFTALNPAPSTPIKVRVTDDGQYGFSGAKPDVTVTDLTPAGVTGTPIHLVPEAIIDGHSFRMATPLDVDTFVVLASSFYAAPTSNFNSFFYVFERISGDWRQTARLEAPYLEARDNGWGPIVRLEGGHLFLASAGANAIDVYERSGARGWAKTSSITPSSQAIRHLAGATFDGDRIAVSAWVDEVVGYSTFIFERAGNAWTERTRIDQTLPGIVRATALRGDLIARTIVGSSPDPNVVEVFTRRDGGYQLVQRTHAFQGPANFGLGPIAIGDGFIAVGAPAENSSTHLSTGALYLIER